MSNIFKLISLITNDIHDILINFSKTTGYNITDKQLHFLIIGIIGIIIFFFTNVIFKYLAKYSITAISFIYTFTVMVVFVFAIEIEQKLTGRGKMEFADVTAGLWGFLEFFAVYLAIKLIVYLVKKLFAELNKESRTKSVD